MQRVFWDFRLGVSFSSELSLETSNQISGQIGDRKFEKSKSRPLIFGKVC
jgi:hypothetical protein